MKREKNYYEEINKALLSYENYKSWHDKPISWICDRIDWCWKWRKITRDQMEELADRATTILNEGDFNNINI